MTRLIAALLVMMGLVAPALAVPAVPRDVDFKVYRDGEEIGHHRVKFSKNGSDLVADTEIELAVTFASIRVFYYRHQSREVWRDGELQSLTSTTHNDGEDLAVNAVRNGDKMAIQGPEFTGEATGPAVPTSYWFAKFVEHGQFLDTQNGRIFAGAIAKIGDERIVAGGKEVVATRYTLSEQLVMNLWYDAAGNWVKTSFEARGSMIDYVLQPPAGEAG
jgi:hypothetical protein